MTSAKVGLLSVPVAVSGASPTFPSKTELLAVAAAVVGIGAGAGVESEEEEEEEVWTTAGTGESGISRDPSPAAGSPPAEVRHAGIHAPFLPVAIKDGARAQAGGRP